MADRDLIADARKLANSIPEGIGALRSLDATRLARARVLLVDLADELEQAHARIAVLEQDVAGWTRVAQKWHRHADVRRGELYTMYDVLDPALARLAELEQQAAQSLGFVIVLKDSDGDLTCLAEVFDPDGARTAEGIGSGYAAEGEAVLIAELREVSDR